MRRRNSRRGAVVVLTALMMVVLAGMVAFAVDYGYLVKIRVDMQRAADAAVLAAVQDLIPAADGSQDTTAARNTLRAYVRNNLEETAFHIPDEDIEIGRVETETIYSNVTLLNSGTFDAIRVTLRRDGATNAAVPLFFARILGTDVCNMTASAAAVLQKPANLPADAPVLPFAVPKDIWDDRPPGIIWSIYGDGKVTDDAGDEISGNWGTVDIGYESNSTRDLNDQILNGLHQADLDVLYDADRIDQNTHIDTTESMWLNAESGLSAGVRSAVEAIHGQSRLVPIVSQSNGASGNNLEFQITGWGVVTIVDSNWGVDDVRINVRKTHLYTSSLTPQSDLRLATGVEGAYTSPMLVE